MSKDLLTEQERISFKEAVNFVTYEDLSEYSYQFVEEYFENLISIINRLAPEPEPPKPIECWVVIYDKNKQITSPTFSSEKEASAYDFSHKKKNGLTTSVVKLVEQVEK